MTLEEEQFLLVLERLVSVKGKALARDEYLKLVSDITGNSHDYITKKLLDIGYLEDGNNYINEKYPTRPDGGYNTVYKIFITDIGAKAYYALKKKKRSECIKRIVFWITAIAAVVSAIFGVLVYTTDDKSQTKQEPISQDTTKKMLHTDTLLLPDTTKVAAKRDSLIISDSSIIDSNYR